MTIQFEVEQGKNWHKYEDSVQQHLVKGVEDGDTSFELKSDDAHVIIDVKNMTQKSSALKKLARVRCVVNSGKDAYSWCGKEGKADRFLTPSLVEDLEEAFSKKKTRLTRDSVVYDLKNMKIKKKGEDDEELKRVECKGKPYDAKVKAVGGLGPVKSDQADSGSNGNADGATKDAKPASKGKRKKNADDSESGGAGEAGPVMKSLIIKGKAPVDSECPAASNSHVYYEDNCVWDCMLNQTNICSNNNKYYLIQLLEDDRTGSYSVWMRWGRVGFKGQTSMTSCGPNVDYAKSVFMRKFSDKTSNQWTQRDKFQKRAGKYDLLKMDYAEDEPDAKKLKTEASGKNKKEIAPCKLEKKVQDLIELICNVKAMEEAVVEMQFDAKKSPLGKLTEDQIKAGYEALKRIDELINNKKMGKELELACSDFYTRIPHNFGMRPPTIIRSSEEVRLKLDLLEALGDIQLALKLMSDEEEEGSRCHPADSQYRALDCDIVHMDRTHPYYKIIEKYLKTTHGHTHAGYSLELLDVYSVVKNSEKDRFVDYGNRMLLWHGSRMTNWAGILGAGLKIAPPEAPSTGYMFGKGIYFADMASKSANYCFASRNKNEGILLLSEVSLGQCNELIHSNYRADLLPKGKHCTKGMGSFAPSPKNQVVLEDGVVVPMGPGVKHDDHVQLMYNEFIVYNVAQVRMRYLLRVKFNWK